MSAGVPTSNSKAPVNATIYSRVTRTKATLAPHPVIRAAREPCLAENPKVTAAAPQASSPTNVTRLVDPRCSAQDAMRMAKPVWAQMSTAVSTPRTPPVSRCIPKKPNPKVIVPARAATVSTATRPMANGRPASMSRMTT